MPKEEITTIKLNKKTKGRLDKLRVHRRESYDEVLQKILDTLNLCMIDPYRAKVRLGEIEKQKNFSKQTN